MKAPLNWIREFVELPETPQEIAHTLTFLGMEVEDVIEVEGDIILDIDITPNRGDCLSIYGLARELSAHFQRDLKQPDLWEGDMEETADNPPEVDVLSSEYCPRYTAIALSGLEVGESPEWLRKRLEMCGIQSVNNIVDITNYVLLEIGQPLHAFDLNELTDRRIVVRMAKKGEKLVLIDGSKADLSEDMLVIADAKEPVAVAGVMGGLDSEVSENTSSILLESAYFEPSQIRRTSKKLNVKSESSYRFERDVGFENPIIGSLRACLLLEEIGVGVVSSPLTDVGLEKKRSSINVMKDNLSSFLGIEDIDYKEVVDKLERLGLEVSEDDFALTVVPPSFRGDLKNREDIYEEIARLIGYNTFPSTLPEGFFKTPEHDREYYFIERVQNTLVKMGLYEVLNFSFVNPGFLKNWGYDDSIKKLIEVANPVSRQMRYLRGEIVPSLLEVVKKNQKYHRDSVRVFEVARVFEKDGDDMPVNERLSLGIVLAGRRRGVLWDESEVGVDYYDLKGIMEVLFKNLNPNDGFAFIKEDREVLSDADSTAVLYKGEEIGYTGSIPEKILEKNKVRPPVVVAEIDLSSVLKEVLPIREYQPISQFPPVLRDIAVIVDEDVLCGALIEVIENEGESIIETVDVFDIYSGKGIPDGRKSIAFALKFQHKERTLTDEEVDDVIKSILKSLRREFSAELRGK